MSYGRGWRFGPRAAGQSARNSASALRASLPARIPRQSLYRMSPATLPCDVSPCAILDIFFAPLDNFARVNASHSTMRLLRPLQPVLAALLAACVLLLGSAAQTPSLHAGLCAYPHAEHDHLEATPHAHGHADDNASTPANAPADNHVCAITLFAAGCEAPALPVYLSEPVLNATRVAHFSEFMLARALRGPARVCGPPADA